MLWWKADTFTQGHRCLDPESPYDKSAFASRCLQVPTSRTLVHVTLENHNLAQCPNRSAVRSASFTRKMPFRLSPLVRLLFAAFSVAVLFYFVPFRDTVAALREMDPRWFATALLTQFAIRAAGTIRMQLISASQGIRLSLGKLYQILLASHYYSMILPGPLIGGGASWIKYRQHGAGTHAAAATVVLNRAIGIGMKIILGICAWFLDRFSEVPTLGLACGLATMLAFATVILLPVSRKPAAQQETPGRGVRRFIRAMLYRAALLGHIPRMGKLTILASALVQDLLGTFAILGFGYAVGAQTNFLEVVWLRAALSLMLMLPLTVAGLGVREASLVGLSALIGVDAVTAVSWSFAILAGTLLVAAVGGLVEARAATGGVSRYLQDRQAQSQKS